MTSRKQDSIFTIPSQILIAHLTTMEALYKSYRAKNSIVLKIVLATTTGKLSSQDQLQWLKHEKN